MNKLKQFAEGKILVDRSGYLRRINQETLESEFSEDNGNTWGSVNTNINLIKNWQPYEQKETYKTEGIEFTVTETEENYELQFQKYPDELRDIEYIDDIEGIKIYSVGMPLYSNGLPYELYLPAWAKHEDDLVVNIPKKDASKNFFDKLLELLEIKLKEVRKPEYLTHSELLEFLEENEIEEYKRLVFEWNGKEWRYGEWDEQILLNSRNGNISSSYSLPAIVFYVQIGKAKVRLK